MGDKLFADNKRGKLLFHILTWTIGSVVGLLLTVGFSAMMRWGY